MPFFPNSGGGGGGSGGNGAAKAQIVTGGSGAATIAADTGIVLMFSVSAPTTLNLPDPGTGKRILIYSFDLPGPQITLSTTGTVNGASTFALPQSVISPGTPQAWEVAGFDNGPTPAWGCDSITDLQIFNRLNAAVFGVRTITGNDTFNANTDYVILCNLSAPATLQMPANMTTGKHVVIRDIAGNFATNKLSVAAQIGQAINGSIGVLDLTINNGTSEFVFDGSGYWSLGLSVL